MLYGNVSRLSRAGARRVSWELSITEKATFGLFISAPIRANPDCDLRLAAAPSRLKRHEHMRWCRAPTSRYHTRMHTPRLSLSLSACHEYDLYEPNRRYRCTAHLYVRSSERVRVAPVKKATVLSVHINLWKLSRSAPPSLTYPSLVSLTPPSARAERSDRARPTPRPTSVSSPDAPRHHRFCHPLPAASRDVSSDTLNTARSGSQVTHEGGLGIVGRLLWTAEIIACAERQVGLDEGGTRRRGSLELEGL
jgi:hypothetical protein